MTYLKEPVIPGKSAFRLYDTFGFPIEFTEELAAERGFQVDRQGYEEAFKKTPGALPCRRRAALQRRPGGYG